MFLVPLVLGEELEFLLELLLHRLNPLEELPYLAVPLLDLLVLHPQLGLETLHDHLLLLCVQLDA